MADPCENMEDRIVELVQGCLEESQVDEVRRHVDECQGCREYYEALVEDGRLLADYVGGQEEAIGRIEEGVIEKLNDVEVKEVNLDLRRRTMSKDFLKMAIAAGLIILAVVIGRGYYMTRDGGVQDEAVVQAPEKETVEPVVAVEDVTVVEVEAPVVPDIRVAEEIDIVEKDVEVAVVDVPETIVAGMVPLPIELPKPMFVGTPTNIKVANLMKPRGKPRPPFYAPAGCVNLAKGKVVTSTDDMPIIGEVEMMNDGDKEAADGSYVELGPFQQHVTIDLEEKCEIYAVLVWHYHKQARVYFDVIVQVADDADFIENVQTVFNNDIDNSAGLGIGKDMHYIETSEGKLVDAKGIKGQFVRLYSNGSNANDLNNYIEIEVWGKPAE